MIRFGRILIVLLIMQVITACESLLGERCGPFDNTPEIITGVSHEIAIHGSLDEEWSTTLTTSTDAILQGDEFGILVKLETIPLAVNNESSGSLVSSAWACSPPPIYVKGQMDSLQIYADKPFEEGLSTDTNLVSYFDVMEAGFSTAFTRLQLPAARVNELFAYEHSYAIYLFPEEELSDEIEDVSFRVVMYFSGEGLETSEVTTAPITLWP